jgi:serine/threonine protein kinase
MNPIKVDGNTTLQQLRDFADQAGDTGRLRGKKNDDGSITLYVKTGKPSAFSGISRSAIAHRALAREAVRTVFDNTDRQAGKAVVGESVRNALDTGMRNDMKGLSLKLLADAGQPTKASNRGPGLTECPGLRMKLDTLAQEIAGHDMNARLDSFGGALKDYDASGIDRAVLAKKLGDMIAETYLAGHTDGEGLALSHGNGLKYDIREALTASLEARSIKLENIQWLDAGFLDEAYNHAASKMLPDRMHDDGSLQIGTDTYRKVRDLAEGGYGTVALYKQVGGDKEIVLKLPKITTEQTHEVAADMMGAEVRAHRQALGTGGNNVVDLVGVVRTPDGRIGMALENMPLKDVYSAGSVIQKATKDGLLSGVAAHAVQMTLLQDIAKGLNQVQTAGGIAHLDFKGPNCLIGSDGVAKVADFGTSIAGDAALRTPDYVAPSNPLWLPPEALVAKDDVRKAGDMASHLSVREHYAGVTSNLKDRFKNIDDDAAKTLKNKISSGLQSTAKQMVPTTIDTAKIDIWALGMTGFNLVFGREVDPSTFLSDSENRLLNFGSNTSNRAIDTTRKDAGAPLGSSFAGSSGSGTTDSLLNLMMHPDPSQRPDLPTLLTHPAFDNPGVGSQTVRDLIKELMSPTPDQGRIKALSDQLTPQLPTG